MEKRIAMRALQSQLGQCKAAPAAAPPRTRRHRAAGVTLIEVLVALLVLGIGLLGLAGLQTVSMQYNHSSFMRTHANNMAYDIADRMRANREAALNGNYDLDIDDSPPGGATVAAQDLVEWYNGIQAALPDADGGVTVAADGTATIEIRWLDDRGEGNATTTFDMETRI